VKMSSANEPLGRGDNYSFIYWRNETRDGKRDQKKAQEGGLSRYKKRGKKGKVTKKTCSVFRFSIDPYKGKLAETRGIRERKKQH